MPPFTRAPFAAPLVYLEHFIRRVARRALLLAALLATTLACSVLVPASPTPAPPPPTTTRVPASATLRPSATQPASATRRPPSATPRLPTRTPRPPTRTATPRALQPTPTPNSSGELFADDFSDPSGGTWNLASETEYAVAIRDGSLVMEMHRPEWSAWSTPGEVAGDFALDVDAVWLEGPEINEYGVVLRLTQDSTHEAFYAFGISSTGEFSLWLLANDEWQDLIAWRDSPAIRTGQGETNHLNVVASGAVLILSVNGAELARYEEATFTTGEFGLYVASGAEAGVVVAFDNLVVAPVAAISPPPSPTPGLDNVLFADDFSDPDAAGWNLAGDDDYDIEIRDGQMRMEMRRAEWSAWTTPGRSVADAAIEVDAIWLDGPQENDFGIVFRLNHGQLEDFYTFGISGTGAYSLWLRRNGDWQDLIPWAPNDAIRTGQGDVNRLRVEVAGTRYTFLVNGEEVAHFDDDTLLEGDYGLYVAAAAEGGVVVAFDNFLVTAP